MTRNLFKKGRSYLAKELNISEQTYILSVVKANKEVYITRTDPNRLPVWAQEKLKIIWITTSQSEKFEKARSPEEAIEKVKKHLNGTKSTVMIDRLDYWVNKWDQKKVLDTLYELNDVVAQSDNTMIISINPTILPIEFVTHLEEEFEKIPLPDFKEQIKERPHFMDLLEYFYRNENANSNDICSRFGITRTTARKRLYWLRDNQYIKIVKCGRENRICLTKKGKRAVM